MNTHRPQTPLFLALASKTAAPLLVRGASHAGRACLALGLLCAGIPPPQARADDPLTITGNKVGILTDNPQAALHVGTGSLWINGAPEPNGLPQPGAGAGVRLSFDTTVGELFSYDYANNKPLDLSLNGPGGNVIIGGGQPAANLVVKGAVTASSITAAGALQASSITATGAVQASSIAATGISADTINVNGPLQAHSIIVNTGATSHPQGLSLEWNRDGGSGFSYLLNQRGYGSGGFIFGTVSPDAGVQGNAEDNGTQPNVVTELMRIDSKGNVGIGTSAAKARLEIKGSQPSSFTNAGTLTGSDTNWHGEKIDPDLSIYADNWIAAFAYVTVSDARIKTIQGRSDGATDLRTLLGIQVTDYRYKDVVAKGNAPNKKVIAQQVEQVFPQAVSKHTDVIPDVYKGASSKDGWVELATDLKKGERVKLITGKGEDSIHEVLEVAEGKFRTAFEPEDGKVFVYGREVKDFRAVDYEAIAMLNVSATQQIKKETDSEVKALRKENAALQSRLGAVEAEAKIRAAELAELKQAVATLAASRPAQNRLHTVSVSGPKP